VAGESVKRKRERDWEEKRRKKKKGKNSFIILLRQCQNVHPSWDPPTCCKRKRGVGGKGGKEKRGKRRCESDPQRRHLERPVARHAENQGGGPVGNELKEEKEGGEEKRKEKRRLITPFLVIPISP